MCARVVEIQLGYLRRIISVACDFLDVFKQMITSDGIELFLPIEDFSPYLKGFIRWRLPIALADDPQLVGMNIHA